MTSPKKSLGLVTTLMIASVGAASAKYDGCGATGKDAGQALQLAKQLKEVEQNLKKTCGENGRLIKSKVDALKPVMASCMKASPPSDYQSWSGATEKFSEITDVCQKMTEELKNTDEKICVVRMQSQARARNLEAATKQTETFRTSAAFRNLNDLADAMSKDNEKLVNEATEIRNRLRAVNDKAEKMAKHAKTVSDKVKSTASNVMKEGSFYRSMMKANANNPAAMKIYDTAVFECRQGARIAEGVASFSDKIAKTSKKFDDDLGKAKGVFRDNQATAAAMAKKYADTADGLGRAEGQASRGGAVAGSMGESVKATPESDAAAAKAQITGNANDQGYANGLNGRPSSGIDPKTAKEAVGSAWNGSRYDEATRGAPGRSFEKDGYKYSEYKNSRGQVYWYYDKVK